MNSCSTYEYECDSSAHGDEVLARDHAILLAGLPYMYHIGAHSQPFAESL